MRVFGGLAGFIAVVLMMDEPILGVLRLDGALELWAQPFRLPNWNWMGKKVAPRQFQSSVEPEHSQRSTRKSWRSIRELSNRLVDQLRGHHAERLCWLLESSQRGHLVAQQVCQRQTRRVHWFGFGLVEQRGQCANGRYPLLNLADHLAAIPHQFETIQSINVDRVGATAT